MLPNEIMPDLVVAADWSASPAKRWMAGAERAGGQYLAGAPRFVGEASQLIGTLAGGGPRLPDDEWVRSVEGWIFDLNW